MLRAIPRDLRQWGFDNYFDPAFKHPSTFRYVSGFEFPNTLEYPHDEDSFLSSVKYLIKHHHTFSGKEPYRMLIWLLEHHRTISVINMKLLIVYSLKHGFLPYLEWCLDRGLQPSITITETAIKYHNADAVKLILKNSKDQADICNYYAAATGYIPALEWLWNKYLLSVNSCAFLARLVDQPQVLEWLASKGHRHVLRPREPLPDRISMYEKCDMEIFQSEYENISNWALETSLISVKKRYFPHLCGTSQTLDIRTLLSNINGAPNMCVGYGALSNINGAPTCIGNLPLTLPSIGRPGEQVNK